VPGFYSGTILLRSHSPEDNLGQLGVINVGSAHRVELVGVGAEHPGGVAFGKERNQAVGVFL
jgi:hypothetical protein